MSLQVAAQTGQLNLLQQAAAEAASAGELWPAVNNDMYQQMMKVL